MTEFTPECIAGARKVVGNDAASTSGRIAFIALDHIEHLQKRVEELEAENKEVKHLCVFALHGLGKLSYEQWHTGDWVNDEIWTKYKKVADEVYDEFGKKYKAMQKRIAELEQERDYLDGRCAALENDLVLDDVVSKLENVQTRLADFENMARAFVEYKAPDHICRMHFDLMLKESED